MRAGKRSIFYGRLRIRPVGAFKRIYIGVGTFVNEEVRFSCPRANITIGSNCLIGPRVAFECASHTLNCDSSGRRQLVTADIVVGDRVWIGAGVTILGGTLISSDVVIGACSLVKGKLESGWIYSGVPARKMRRINEN